MLNQALLEFRIQYAAISIGVQAGWLGWLGVAAPLSRANPSFFRANAKFFGQKLAFIKYSKCIY